MHIIAPGNEDVTAVTVYMGGTMLTSPSCPPYTRGCGPMTLQYRGAIDLPPGQPGGFDHADVHTPTGAVFVAHTAFDQVEIIDGPGGKHRMSVPDCREGSGVLY